MPQLDVNDFAPQLIWLAISFILLYLIMSRLALPRVGSILEERAGRIAGDLATAAKLREETAQAIADYEKALADAKARAQAIARKAREETIAAIEAQRAESDRQIAARMADAEKRITTLKEAALTHVGEIATETAEALVARLLGKPVDRKELQVAVNEALGK
ncbi:MULTISPECIES: F0F1 ATP synthase subunit B' [Rhodomicrobium]|uniref:F0F1 ATP synthase subunit B family protein n=1 Tax=Rhodomicrobium TaxID=1068 RepID=UPI000B4B5667|nr:MULTISPECIES: F0F1 ATP synthase subunit B' [Rhodomicrobium]